MPLGGLARPDSLYLLAAVLDVKGISTGRAGYERAEIDRLLEALADHPLSVELVAPHLRALTPAEILGDYTRLLERFADEGAFESRNRSLLASLEFSKGRLSEPAREVLPYLAWFEGGVFEQFLLDFTGLEPAAWEGMRDELVATALVSVEDDLKVSDRPYIRFHPTLPYAARHGQTSEVSETSEVLEERFIDVYLNVRRTADDALHGRRPAAGMALLAREEANLRAATARAFARGARREGGAMAGTLGEYLERAGRLRERDALVAWARSQTPDEGGLDGAACEATWRHAWSLFTQGKAAEAVGEVQALIARLEAEGLAGSKDPTFQIAVGYRYLGLSYVEARRPDLALEPARKAIAMFEGLPGDAARGNLSAALGDLANAYRALGRFEAALEAAGRGLVINRQLGRDRDIAAGLVQIAHILTQQQRYAEAEARYDEALRAARAAGDLGSQGATLQHQGNLQHKLGHHDRAVDLYQQATALFQRAGNPGGEMQTCDLLASAECDRGHLDAAGAWYARSRELAEKLNDRAQLAANAQNVGILYQTRAEEAAARGDHEARAALLSRAVTSVEESLAGWLELNNQVNAASSYSQLGVLHRMLGDLDQAEKSMRQALQIYEAHNLPDVYKVYGNLAGIARDRGDAAAAARWQAKYETKLAELERLRRGEGTEEGEMGEGGRGRGGAEEQLATLILALAQAAYQARAAQRPPCRRMRPRRWRNWRNCCRRWERSRPFCTPSPATSPSRPSRRASRPPWRRFCKSWSRSVKRKT